MQYRNLMHCIFRPGHTIASLQITVISSDIWIERFSLWWLGYSLQVIQMKILKPLWRSIMSLKPSIRFTMKPLIFWICSAGNIESLFVVFSVRNLNKVNNYVQNIRRVICVFFTMDFFTITFLSLLSLNSSRQMQVYQHGLPLDSCLFQFDL